MNEVKLKVCLHEIPDIKLMLPTCNISNVDLEKTLIDIARIYFTTWFVEDIKSIDSGVWMLTKMNNLNIHHDVKDAIDRYIKVSGNLRHPCEDIDLAIVEMLGEESDTYFDELLESEDETDPVYDIDKVYEGLVNIPYTGSTTRIFNLLPPNTLTNIIVKVESRLITDLNGTTYMDTYPLLVDMLLKGLDKDEC